MYFPRLPDEPHIPPTIHLAYVTQITNKHPHDETYHCEIHKTTNASILLVATQPTQHVQVIQFETTAHAQSAILKLQSFVQAKNSDSFLHAESLPGYKGFLYDSEVQ